MARGMPPQNLAQAAIDGVERGDFYIVTHASRFERARARFEEIEGAFRAQGPMTADSTRYDVNTIMTAVPKDFRAASE